MIFELSLLLMLISKPVIELDDLQVEGEIRRPPMIDLKASQLNEKLEKTAVYNLSQLEKRLLKPLNLSDFQKIQKSAK